MEISAVINRWRDAKRVHETLHSRMGRRPSRVRKARRHRSSIASARGQIPLVERIRRRGAIEQTSDRFHAADGWRALAFAGRPATRKRPPADFAPARCRSGNAPPSAPPSPCGVRSGRTVGAEPDIVIRVRPRIVPIDRPDPSAGTVVPGTASDRNQHVKTRPLAAPLHARS